MPAPAGAAEKAIILAKLKKSTKGLPHCTRDTNQQQLNHEFRVTIQKEFKPRPSILHVLHCHYGNGRTMPLTLISQACSFSAWSEDLLLCGVQFSSHASNRTANSYRWGPSVFENQRYWYRCQAPCPTSQSPNSCRWAYLFDLLPHNKVLRSFTFGSCYSSRWKNHVAEFSFLLCFLFSKQSFAFFVIVVAKALMLYSFRVLICKVFARDLALNLFQSACVPSLCSYHRCRCCQLWGYNLISLPSLCFHVPALAPPVFCLSTCFSEIILISSKSMLSMRDAIPDPLSRKLGQCCLLA